MPAYSTIFFAIIPVFLVMIAGGVFQKAGWLEGDLETGMMKLVLNLLTPCLIFTKIAGNPVLEKASVAVWSISVGAAMILAGYAVSWAAGRLSGLQRGDGLRTFTISTGTQNYGFMALPVVMELWPGDPGPAGLIFVHGLGVELAIWSVGLMILAGHSGSSWKNMVNGPFLAVVLSLTLHYSGGHVLVPGVARTAMGWLGDCAIPMSLFMIGATIGRLFERQFWRDAAAVAVTSCVVRLGILAGLFLVAAKYLPAPEALRSVLIVQAGMPAAVFSIVIARLYGGRPQTAIQVVLATTTVSALTAPLVIALGIAWVK